MEQASNILSNALLSGMTMTDKECKTCQSPLMRPRNSKLSHCVVCEELKSTIAEEEKTPEPTKVEEFTQVETNSSVKRSNNTGTQVDNTSEEDHYAKKSRASESIGRKLLQGWTMLQEYCQNQNCIPVPLVRNKELISICVLCNTQYLRENDFNTELHSKLNLVNSNTIANGNETKSVSITKSENSITENTQKPLIEQVIAPKITATFNSNTDSNNIKLELEQTLNQKLVELNKKLQISQNLQEIQDILKCIELAFNTLNSIKK